MKTTEIRIKYSNERTRAIKSVLAKKGTTLEIEVTNMVENLYKKTVKQEVRDFIEELENEG